MGSMDMVAWKGYIFSLLTSLSSGGMMGRMGSIVVGGECDIVNISKLVGALRAIVETGTAVWPCPFALLGF
jgi:hypothetical protein